MFKLKPWILLLGLLLSSHYVNAAEHAIILQYHHVSDKTPKITSISPELFKWHLNYLHQQGFTVWPLSKIVAHLDKNIALPDKCVAITFDDAYRSIYTTAFPLLKEKNWPFTLFLNTDAVGDGNLSLSWDEIREMNASVAEIANHTQTHAHLIRHKKNESPQLWRERVIAEIQTAQQIIDQQLSGEKKASPHLFAYPYGEYSLALYQIIKDLGYAAVGQHSGPAAFDTPRELLPRFPMGGNYTKKSQLIEKLKTYPLPLTNSDVIEPVIHLNTLESNLKKKNKPQLKLTIKPEMWTKSLQKQLQCYVSGQGKALIYWKANTAIIQAKEALGIGRNRYNCTAPTSVTSNGKRQHGFYWYSQLWIKRHDNGHWYHE